LHRLIAFLLLSGISGWGMEHALYFHPGNLWWSRHDDFGWRCLSFEYGAAPRWSLLATATLYDQPPEHHTFAEGQPPVTRAAQGYKGLYLGPRYYFRPVEKLYAQAAFAYHQYHVRENPDWDSPMLTREVLGAFVYLGQRYEWKWLAASFDLGVGRKIAGSARSGLGERQLWIPYFLDFGVDMNLCVGIMI
jgi:hypothetical protein